MGINIAGGADIAVPQPLLNFLQAHAVGVKQACLRTSLFCFLLYQLSLWWVKYRAQPEAIST